MSTSIVVMAASGILITALYLLNKAETAKGQRLFLSSLRSRLDSIVIARTENWNQWKKYVGASSFRLFLHYLLHQGLGFALFVIRWIEGKLHGLRRRNKMVARVTSDNDNHLSHIAKHKEEVALSEEEQQERRERILNDQ